MKFAKKSAIVVAFQFHKEEPTTSDVFGVVNFGTPKAEGDDAPQTLDGQYWMPPMERPRFVNDKDWIVKDSTGYISPCSPEVLDAEYEWMRVGE